MKRKYEKEEDERECRKSELIQTAEDYAAVLNDLTNEEGKGAIVIATDKNISEHGGYVLAVSGDRLALVECLANLLDKSDFTETLIPAVFLNLAGKKLDH